MKFEIRDGFAVHLEQTVEAKTGAGTVKQVQTQSFFPGQPVELDAAQAMAHLHKLEPGDKESEKFLAEYHRKQDAARNNRVVDDGPSLEERVAVAVATALAKAGVIGAPAGK